MGGHRTSGKGRALVLGEGGASVAQVGPDAWKTLYVNKFEPKPWAKVGDRVISARYGGRYIKDPDTDKQYFLCDAQDVYCVVTDEKKK